MTEAIRNLLEEYFDTAFAAPDGIAKLRELILTLAMQGKLVAQDPKDPSASELLKEIEAEKQRLVKAGKIKKPKPLPPIKPEEVPYQLPQGWAWVRLPECYFGIGNKSNQIQTKDYRESGQFPVVDQGKNFITGYNDDGSKLLHIDRPVIVFGDHTKNIKFIDFDFIIGADGVKVLCPFKAVLTKFLYRLIQSFDLTDRGYARHFKVLNEKFAPLPPLPEQHRIVTRIDQLMARCDELEKLRAAATAQQTELLNFVMAQV
ncbi:restriction endonuclease subunit S [Desulfurivibrio sp. D14AmB]|uniref:restriction endonuclease subunit S n=1 Tax=Desulfurivibrio sp. D14AmB TaxID=3374370 RepID=UPI00376EC139